MSSGFLKGILTVEESICNEDLVTLNLNSNRLR